jgi:hypothetical protein
MEFITMAQACGEAPISSPGWVPGEDFNPFDDDDMEVMRLVWARESADEMARLRQENADLRARIAELAGDEYDGDAYLNAAYDDAL